MKPVCIAFCLSALALAACGCASSDNILDVRARSETISVLLEIEQNTERGTCDIYMEIKNISDRDASFSLPAGRILSDDEYLQPLSIWHNDKKIKPWSLGADVYNGVSLPPGHKVILSNLTLSRYGYSGVLMEAYIYPEYRRFDLELRFTVFWDQGFKPEEFHMKGTVEIDYDPTKLPSTFIGWPPYRYQVIDPTGNVIEDMTIRR